MRQLLEPENVASEARERTVDVWVIDRRAWRWLTEEDRAMVELAQRGGTRRMIAAAVGMSAGNVSRRIQNVRTRLMSSNARFLLEPTCPLPDQVREVAGDYLIGGKAAREISRTRRIPLYLVHRHINYASGLLRAMSRRAQSVA
jgi:hypothetical protein